MIEDNLAPTISCPPDVVANVNAGICVASGINLGVPTTSDNCSTTVTNNAPSTFSLGNTVVTWTVSDIDGNSSQCTQIFNGRKSQWPTATKVRTNSQQPL